MCRNKKNRGVGLPMSSLGTYNDNLSDREKKRGGGYWKTKKWGGGGYVSQ